MTRPVSEARILHDTRLRLLAWSGGSTLVVLLALGVALHATVASSLAGETVERIRERADNLRAMAERTTPPPFARPLTGQIIATAPSDPGLVLGGATSGTLGIVIAPDGSTGLGLGRADSVPALGLPDEAGYRAALAGQTDIRDAELGGVPGRILSLPIEVRGETWVVQVFADRVAEERTLATLRVVLAVGGVAVLLVALALGWLYAGRALVPIRQSLARQREFAADASHELRTPIAIVRSGVEELRRTATRSNAAPPAALEDIEAGVDRLTSVVDDLLFLARADSGALQLDLSIVDLGEVTADALGDLAPIADAAGVGLRLAAVPAPIEGDSRRLAQLATILVDNAIRHGRAGGRVEVVVEQADGAAVLAVSDDGPGLNPADIDRVFDRFWRAQSAPSGGTGLGLAIAAWIVDRHGGSIRATNRHGGGARFVARFPLRHAT